MDDVKSLTLWLLLFSTGAFVLSDINDTVDDINTTVSSNTPTTSLGTTTTTTITTTTTTTTTSATTFTTKAMSTTSTERSRVAHSGDLLDYIRKYNSAVTLLDPHDDTDYNFSTKPELDVNKAWLTINSTLETDIELWAQTEECYKCDLMLITTIGSHGVRTVLANATHQTDLKLVQAKSADLLCSFHQKFREGGDYWIFVDYSRHGQNASCQLILANDPDIAELPILYVFLGLVGLAIAYVAVKKLYLYARRASAHKSDSMDVTTASDQDGGDVLQMNNGTTNKEDKSTDTNKVETPAEKQKQRLRSLDTFRGLSLMLMIFVNYGGGGYWFFEHATWNGINVADLVFPWFVFIMGVSMNFSFRSMFRKGWTIPRITWKIVWRAAKLFLIGFMMGTHFETADMEKVRIFGVLQRLALTYLVSALIHYCCTRRSDSHEDSKWAMVRDLVLYLPEWAVNLILLAVHSSLVYALPVPGCPTGYTGPGGISEGGRYKNCTGGATGYIDSVVLGYQHMYGHPTAEAIYQTPKPFDPEGLVATLNSVFLCFLGIQCGRIVLIYKEHKQRLIRFLIWAVFLGALAALLTKCSKDDGWIPANKNLWSFSFTLITASFGYILLSAIYIISDVFGLWEGQPFIYPGMNSIVIYVCHDIFSNTFPVSFEVGNQHWKLLLRCVWGTSCWVIVAYWLYVKKIFIAL